jgi:hypothetical protein
VLHDLVVGLESKVWHALLPRVGVSAAVVLDLKRVDGQAKLLFKREVVVRLRAFFGRIKGQRGRGALLLGVREMEVNRRSAGAVKFFKVLVRGLVDFLLG